MIGSSRSPDPPRKSPRVHRLTPSCSALSVAAAWSCWRGVSRLRRWEIVFALTGIGLATLRCLVAVPMPPATQPFPDAAEYVDAALHLSRGDGYVTTIHSLEPKPPRYPPGFSLALAPFVGLIDPPERGAAIGARVYAVVYVTATVAAAGSLGGVRAAGVAAVLVGLSPFGRTSATMVMSDALSAALVVTLVPLLRVASAPRALGAGVLGASVVLVRTSALVVLLALAAATPRRQLRWLGLGAALPLAALALHQWWVFGNPLATGYGYWLPHVAPFQLSLALPVPGHTDGPWLHGDVLGGHLFAWACPCPVGGPQAALPNILFYPALLLGLFWVYAPPLATLPGLVWAWRRRRQPVARYVLAATAGDLLLYTFYFYQATRFVAGAATLLVVASAAWLGTATVRAERAPGRAPP